MVRNKFLSHIGLIIGCVFIQTGFMMYMMKILIFFHQLMDDVTSIIGLLSIVIGLAMANYAGYICYKLITKGLDMNSYANKINNIATFILVTFVPLMVYKNLDYLELNLTEIVFYIIGISLLFIGCGFVYLLSRILS